MSHLFAEKRSLTGAAVLAALVQILPAVAVSADEWIELHIPLHEGRFYSRHDVCRECNAKLHGDYDLRQIPDRRLELTPLERAALQLAQEAGLLQVDIQRNRLILGLADREDDRVRRRHRRRLERLLGLSLPEWPADKGLVIPDDFDPRRRTLLLIHGLESGAPALERFRSACAAWGIQTLVFEFPNDGPPAWAGEQLSGELKSLAEEHPEVQLAVVGHSLGGLVARYALETPGRDPGCVSDLFLLGTPNRGSQLAGLQDWLELIFEGLPGRLRPEATLQSGLGEAAADLRPGSRFLAELNGRQRPPGVAYHVAIGNRGVTSDERLAEIRTEVLEIARRRRVTPQLKRRIEVFLSADELRGGRGDGVVSVQSAELADVATRRVFAWNHLELIQLPAEPPESNELFQWIVTTLQWPREVRP